MADTHSFLSMRMKNGIKDAITAQAKLENRTVNNMTETILIKALKDQYGVEI